MAFPDKAPALDTEYRLCVFLETDMAPNGTYHQFGPIQAGDIGLKHLKNVSDIMVSRSFKTELYTRTAEGFWESVWRSS